MYSGLWKGRSTKAVSEVYNRWQKPAQQAKLQAGLQGSPHSEPQAPHPRPQSPRKLPYRYLPTSSWYAGARLRQIE